MVTSRLDDRRWERRPPELEMARTRKRSKTRSPRHPSDVDRLIGERIQKRRIVMGMSLQDLAASIGVTFQQLQKYEKGSNRITAGRLLLLSDALDIGVSSLLGPLDRKVKSTHDELLDNVGAAANADLLLALFSLSQSKRKAILGLAVSAASTAAG
jgi:transcriptional regulator with XRE-family HTH domain